MGRHRLPTTYCVRLHPRSFWCKFGASAGPDLAGRKPVPVFQERTLLCAARGKLTTRSGAIRRGPCRATSSGAPSAASTIPTARIPPRRTAAPRPRAALSAEPARLGSPDPRRHLLQPRCPAEALRSDLRSPVFLGHGAKEDYVLPDAHTVTIRIAPAQARRRHRRLHLDVASAPRRRQGGNQKQACKNPLTIARVPYSLEQRNSGVSVAVTLPDGRQFADRDVVVEDLFIVALGDSFGSGESNPDRPVQFSPSRELVYDPKLLQDEVAQGPERSRERPPKRTLQSVLGRRPARSEGSAAPADGRRAGGAVLPDFADSSSEPPSTRRRRNGSAATATARSTAIRCASRMQLALENRHRSVTLATFSCSGAEIAQGPVPGDGCPRRLLAAGDREGSRPARSTERPHVPRRRGRPHAADELHAADLSRRAARRSRTSPHRWPGARPICASGRSTWCCSRSAATTSASAGLSPMP